MKESTSSHKEWELQVPELHRRIVETGMFDSIPQTDEFEDGEVVVARRNGDIYHVQELDGETVRIWYKTEEGEADEIVARNDIRPIDGYAQIAYQIAEPMTEIFIDKQGHALIKRQAPPFPGTMN